MNLRTNQIIINKKVHAIVKAGSVAAENLISIQKKRELAKK